MSVPCIEKECKHHGMTSHYLLKSENRYRCKKCNVEGVTKRRRQVKADLVKEFGGKCMICSYDKCQEALQFHHLDPDEKSFSLSHAGNTCSYDKMLAEAKKCVLLCANCHAEIENGITILPDNIRCIHGVA